jgi:hypothetical protein
MIGVKPSSILPPPSSIPSQTSDPPPETEKHPPPWQVRWKRPRLDLVSIDGKVGEDWIPISSSSVVLTRDEARRSILELDKRDKLLLKRVSVFASNNFLRSETMSFGKHHKRGMFVAASDNDHRDNL